VNPKLYGYAAALLGIALALGGAAWWGHRKGRVAQAADDAALIARKNAALLAASGSLANAAGALRSVSVQTRANAAAAAQAQASAQAASEDAAQAKKAFSAAQATWQRRYANARRQPDCRTVLEMHLCPAVSE
jgi:hypothetical protein